MSVADAAAIRAKLKQYAEAPETLANSVVKLTDRPGFRLRVGDWRVIFSLTATEVQVRDILRRNEDTYR